MNAINIASYNVRGFYSSRGALSSLLNSCDILLVQEHWLNNDNLSALGTLHNEFTSVGVSAMDSTQGILTGRPFGGVGIIWRKNLHGISPILIDCESRVVGIRMKMADRPDLVIFNVYMPTQNSDSDEFQRILGVLQVAINDLGTCCCIIAGDFNTDPGKKHVEYFLLDDFVKDNNFISTDIERLPANTSTYLSDSCSAKSWLDHIICTKSADAII